MKPPHIGISFSDKSIKAVSFDIKNPRSNLKVFITPLEPGTIVDGSIANFEEIVKKLSVIKTNFSSPFVFFALPDEISYVFSAEVPAIPGSDLSESVAFIMEENVPLALCDIIFDYAPVKINNSGSENTSLVVVAAGVKRETQKYTDVLKGAGFEPVGCIHESQAISGAVVPKEYKGTAYIVHAREDRVGIHLVKNSFVCFSTIRNISGSYKKEFLDEYEKFEDYCSRYNSNSAQTAIPVFVCGEFESAKTAIEVLVGLGKSQNAKLSNVWNNVLNIAEHIPDIPYEKSLSFAGAIGAVSSDIE